ncbi:MAG: pyrimidine 5'-nucleotidase, partial [Stellaceae bacterium]
MEAGAVAAAAPVLAYRSGIDKVAPVRHITAAPMSLTDSPPRARSFGHIDTWIFDLDNTLYPSSCRLYIEVEQRMARYIMDELKLDLAGAHALRQRYFQEHGTTLRGLMNEYGVEPRRFLDYVHEIDVSAVQPAPALSRALTALPGRKLVFTNGTRRHAERVLDRLELIGHFDAIHDIVAIDFQPKPNAAGYRALIETYAIEPARAAMVEDMARNLPPAAVLGMTTIWLRGGPHDELDARHAP